MKTGARIPNNHILFKAMSGNKKQSFYALIELVLRQAMSTTGYSVNNSSYR
ncbi:hypothetical protein [Nostoc sp.]|uniref:hypothetical protein n=1 Tax=Nostoc sp. TaxID=1180 RepID=UPI002FF556F6